MPSISRKLIISSHNNQSTFRALNPNFLIGSKHFSSSSWVYSLVCPLVVQLLFWVLHLFVLLEVPARSDNNHHLAEMKPYNK